jgi:hypothetical protein
MGNPAYSSVFATVSVLAYIHFKVSVDAYLKILFKRKTLEQADSFVSLVSSVPLVPSKIKALGLLR